MAGNRRGLSTSGSLLIVFAGMFLALSVAYSVTANTAERIADASEDRAERHRAVQLTTVNVTGATWDTTTSNLTVTVNNTGDTVLSVPDADTVVDGNYVPVSDYERVEVEGRASDLWRPGEQLVLEDDDTVATFDSAPGRVRVVTETGVADAAEVSET